jgi:hypothetical protein
MSAPPQSRSGSFSGGPPPQQTPVSAGPGGQHAPPPPRPQEQQNLNQIVSFARSFCQPGVPVIAFGMTLPAWIPVLLQRSSSVIRRSRNNFDSTSGIAPTTVSWFSIQLRPLNLPPRFYETPLALKLVERPNRFQTFQHEGQFCWTGARPYFVTDTLLRIRCWRIRHMYRIHSLKSGGLLMTRSGSVVISYQLRIGPRMRRSEIGLGLEKTPRATTSDTGCRPDDKTHILMWKRFLRICGPHAPRTYPLHPWPVPLRHVPLGSLLFL